MPGPFDNLDNERTPEELSKEQGLAKKTKDIATVDLTEDPDDDPEPVEAGKQLSPKEIRSRERYQENRRKAEENEKKAAELETRLRETEARAARAEGAALAAQRMQPQTPQEDPLEKGIKEKEREFARLHQIFEANKATATPDQINKWQEEARNLQREQRRLEYQQVQRDSGQQRGPDPEAAARKVQFETLFPDIVSKKGNLAVADDIYEDLVRAGAAHGFETAKKAAEQARKKLGLGTRPAPTDGERAKYTGKPVGQSAGGNQGAGTMTLTQDQQKMAFALYGKRAGGDQAKANKMWAQGPGKRVMSKTG